MADYFINNIVVILIVVFVLYFIFNLFKNKKTLNNNNIEKDLNIFLKKILISFENINFNIKKIDKNNILIEINIKNSENIENLEIENKLNDLIKNKIKNIIENNKDIFTHSEYNISLKEKDVKIYLSLSFKDSSFFEQLYI